MSALEAVDVVDVTISSRMLPGAPSVTTTHHVVNNTVSFASPFEGTVSVTLLPVDAAGNRGTATVLTIAVVSVAPVAVITTAPPSLSNLEDFTLAVSAPATLARFMDYVASKPKVWVATREEIARHWMKVHPAK